MIRYSKIKPRSGKYNAKKVIVDGIEFDSQREAHRWKELQLLQRAGEITELERQVPYLLIPAQYDQVPVYQDGRVLKYKKKCIERECKYYADFKYKDKTGKVIVEDTKGYRTKDYLIKRKLMLHEYGIRIKEI